MFCGVNYHWKIVTFVGGFISNDDKSAFIWLFDRFTECMGHAPPAMITD